MLEKNIKANYSWQAPSNIALIKYWGKKGHQRPQNPSLSFSLTECFSKTELKITKLEKIDLFNEEQVELYFGGERNGKIQKRVYLYLDLLQRKFSILKNFKYEIRTKNSFPHGAGIASSASGFGALSLCLGEMLSEFNIFPSPSQVSEFAKCCSNLARLGSGSAARSLYADYCYWGENEIFTNSNDEYALPLGFEVHPLFHRLKNTVILLDQGEKSVSSSIGHELMVDHPYAKVRYAQAHTHFSSLVHALQEGDWQTFVEIVEAEAMELHALMMTSTPSVILLAPSSLSCLSFLKKKREELGLSLCYTIDAGPNIHVLYLEKDEDRVKSLLESSFEKNQLIHDQIGLGPLNSNPSFQDISHSNHILV